MKVFIDTNILISSMLFKNSKVSMAYEKLVQECDCYISNKTIYELRSVFLNKFRDKLDILDNAIKMMLKKIKIIDDVDFSYPLENTIRDKKDIYVYRCAKWSKCDAIITGDKDLLDNKELDIRIITVSDFLQM